MADKSLQEDGYALRIIRDNTICDCNERCTEDTCPCMNLPCGDDEEIWESPRGCLAECSCIRRPDENREECDN